MLLDHLSVKHSVFGDGTVTATDGRYFTVTFASAVKKFVYPDAFEKFLVPNDPTVMEVIRADLETVKAEKDKILKKKEEENLLAMTHGIVIPGKEIQTEIKEDDPNAAAAEDV